MLAPLFVLVALSAIAVDAAPKASKPKYSPAERWYAKGDREYVPSHSEALKEIKEIIFPQLTTVADVEGHKITDVLLGVGTQNYVCNDTSRTFILHQPVASLFDRKSRFVGLHSFQAVPDSKKGQAYWMANADGSMVITTKIVAVDAPVDKSDNVPWLMTKMTRQIGSNFCTDGGKRCGYGRIGASNFVARINTVGGQAPQRGCGLGEEVDVPYSASYVFFK